METTESTEKVISKELEQEIDKYLNGKVGIRILDASEWHLPVYELSVQFSIAKNRKFNIVEEFIFKCIDTGLPELSNLEGIKSILKIDEIFIENRIHELSQNGLLKKENNQLVFTPLGRESYQNGIVPSSPRQEELTFFYEPMFQKVRKEDRIASVETDQLFKYCDFQKDRKAAQDLRVTEKEIVEIGNRLGGVYLTESIESIIRDIQLPEITLRTYLKFGEFWVYDMIEDKVYSCVWDQTEKRFREDIQSFLDNQESEARLQTVHQEMEERNEYYNLIRDALKKQKDAPPQNKKNKKQAGPKTNDEVSILRGMQIRDAFLRSFADAKQKIMIISPWISETVIDEPMLQRFKQAAERNVVIYIGWGIAKSQALEDRAPSKRLLKKMRSIRDKQGNPAVFVNWIGNHHDKEIIVDNSYHMLGSFNWLSYRGDHNIRSESVYKIKNENMISDAIHHTESLFLELQEKRIKALQTEIEYLTVISEIIHLDTHEEQKQALIGQATDKLKANQQFDVLFSICNLFIQKNKFKFGFQEIFNLLLDSGSEFGYYKSVLDVLYKQNRILFDQLLREHSPRLQALQYKVPVEEKKTTNKAKPAPVSKKANENKKGDSSKPNNQAGTKKVEKSVNKQNPVKAKKEPVPAKTVKKNKPSSAKKGDKPSEKSVQTHSKKSNGKQNKTK